MGGTQGRSSRRSSSGDKRGDPSIELLQLRVLYTQSGSAHFYRTVPGDHSDWRHELEQRCTLGAMSNLRCRKRALSMRASTRRPSVLMVMPVSHDPQFQRKLQIATAVAAALGIDLVTPIGSVAGVSSVSAHREMLSDCALVI